jgi:hypothetical protein
MSKRGYIFFLSVFLLSSASALAEWQLVSDDGFSKIYVDPKSKKMLPHGVAIVNALTDYDPNSDQARSFGLADKGLSEIEAVSLDCINTMYKSEGGNWFKEHMGHGEISKKYDPNPNWSSIPQFYKQLALSVCSK